MILHKYIDKFGLDTLENCRIKVNVPTDFNDPFEMLCRKEGELTRKLVKNELTNKHRLRKLHAQIVKGGTTISFKQFKEDVRRNESAHIKQLLTEYPKKILNTIGNLPKMAKDHMRLACFSRPIKDSCTEILMWSHYTDSHKGMRIHFDTSFFNDEWKKNTKPVEYFEERAPIHIQDLFGD